MSQVNYATECFSNGFNCAQAVLSTYCEELGLDKETAFKLSCGLGAGMGRLCHVCGAVSGAYLLIGLKYGQTQENDKDATEKTYSLIQEFTRRFEERNNSTICKELLGVDLLSCDKDVAIKKVKTICPKMVQDAVEIVEEILM